MCCNILQQFLTSDMKTFTLHSKKARHNKVWLATGPSRCSEWRIIPILKKLFRMELEYTPVPVSIVIDADKSCAVITASCIICAYYLFVSYGINDVIDSFLPVAVYKTTSKGRSLHDVC